jgi:hypothetical protein
VKMPSNISLATLADLEFVAKRMRADEIEQHLAFTGAPEYDPSAMALQMANLGPIRYTLVDKDGYPLVTAGWYHVYPGVMQCWMMGTEEAWDTHWITITKGCRWLMEELFKLGTVKRLQMNSLASRTQAIEWYKSGLLMKPCGVVENYGANGEAVAFFAREVPDGNV